MRRDLFQEIEIPAGLEANIDGDLLRVKGPEGENRRAFGIHGLVFKKEGDKIIIGREKSTKNEKARMNSIAAHIRNMMKGVKEKYEYKVKVCSSHFPINVEVKGKEVIIKNFIGEKVPRKANIPDGAEVSVKSGVITIKSTDKEIAGQAAANLETATKISKRDRRVFQDGLYITSKAGEEI